MLLIQAQYVSHSGNLFIVSVFISNLFVSLNCKICQSIVAACGRSGEWEHALNLFQSMKKSGLVPDRVCYNTLLSAFMNSGKDDEVSTILLRFERRV